MGADAFKNTGKGQTAKAVFAKLVSDAQYDYGHAGYTGTIAEKDDFEEFAPPANVPPKTFIEWATEYPPTTPTWPNWTAADQKVLDKARRIADDKWGPAACVKTGDGEWTFFGYASS